MRRSAFILLVLFIAAPAALADTIHLKNGSVLKGKVTRFADDQFIVLLDTGSGRSMSRAMVYIGDVARIEFDGTAADASGTGGTTPADSTSTSIPQNTQTREIPRDDPPAESNPRSRAADPQPRETGAGRSATRQLAAPTVAACGGGPGYFDRRFGDRGQQPLSSQPRRAGSNCYG